MCHVPENFHQMKELSKQIDFLYDLLKNLFSRRQNSNNFIYKDKINDVLKSGLRIIQFVLL